MLDVKAWGRPVGNWIAAPDWSRLDRYIALATTVVFASFYVLGKDGRLLFYLICLIPMLVYLRPSVIREVSANWYWRLAVGLCGLWLVSIAWSDEVTWETIYDTVRVAVVVAIFLTGGIVVACRGRINPDRLLDTIAFTAGVTGLVVLLLAWHPMMYWDSSRLTGFGWAAHPGIAGDIYAFAGLIALVRFVENEQRRRRYVAAAVAVTAVIFLFLTESRGSVLAFVIGGLILMVFWKPRNVLGALAIFAIVAALASATGAIDFGQWIERGPTNRFDIWRETLDLILAHPLLGAGAATPLHVAGHNSAHNIFLSIQYNLGIPGSVLFLALSLLAITHAWRLACRGQVLYLVLLVFAFAVMMTHTQSVIINLSREWLIFWLPIMLLSAHGSPFPSARRSAS